MEFTKDTIPEISRHGEQKATNSFVASSRDIYIINKISRAADVSTSRAKRYLIRQALIALLGNSVYDEFANEYKAQQDAMTAKIAVELKTGE